MVDKALILNELKRHKNFATDKEFALFLGISSQNLSAWYKRNTFDENKIVDLFPDINKIWILTGEGEMLKTETREFEIPKQSAENVTMPREVWEVIKNQAESLKSKDTQTSDMIELLKEQLKKSDSAVRPFRAASSVVVVEDE